jgi:hypothetical protein
MPVNSKGYAEWSVTSATAASGGITATKAALADVAFLRRHVCTNIQCSGDAAALVTIESPANTILWRQRFAAAFNMSQQFDTGLLGGADVDMLVKVSASTSNVEANMQGYSVREG